VSSRSSSSESKAASAERMAALLEGVGRVERRVSAVREGLERPMWRCEGERGRAVRSVLSKMLWRVGRRGGVVRGARCGAREVWVLVLVWWLEACQCCRDLIGEKREAYISSVRSASRR